MNNSLTEQVNGQENNTINKMFIKEDLNSQIGGWRSGEEVTIGVYTYDQRNERGEILISFCQENNFQIINTCLKIRKGRRLYNQ